MRVSEVLVVGGSGFIGRHLVSALAAEAIKVTVPSRRRDRAKHLILLPTVDVIEADVCQPGMLERLVRGKHAVVNLAGILHGDFERVHVELPRALVAACRAQGVRRLLHVSALGASVDGPSEYLRSKGVGEEVVLGARELDVTVFRPSVLFGPEDRFLNRFAGLARVFPVLPLACPEARFQPVYVGDVAAALHRALDEPDTFGKTYELCGPTRYTLRELVRYVCALTGRRRLIVGLPPRLSYLQAAVLEKLPGRLMTRDNYRSMQSANVCSGAFPFGIQPQALEAAAPLHLMPAGPRERYAQLRWRARR